MNLIPIDKSESESKNLLYNILIKFTILDVSCNFKYHVRLLVTLIQLNCIPLMTYLTVNLSNHWNQDGFLVGEAAFANKRPIKRGCRPKSRKI